MHNNPILVRYDYDFYLKPSVRYDHNFPLKLGKCYVVRKLLLSRDNLFLFEVEGVLGSYPFECFSGVKILTQQTDEQINLEDLAKQALRNLNEKP